MWLGKVNELVRGNALSLCFAFPVNTSLTSGDQSERGAQYDGGEGEGVEG